MYAFTIPEKQKQGMKVVSQLSLFFLILMNYPLQLHLIFSQGSF